MHWKEWYVFEVVTGLCTIVAIWPLDRLHFWAALGFGGLFAVAYAQRMIGQTKEYNESGKL